MLATCSYTRIKYYKALLSHIHLDAVSFLNKLKEKDAYEGLIYQWMEELYQQQKSIKEAKLILQKRRYQYYCQKNFRS
ncbi:hypothetical protein NBT05_06410 [Aquimarina sp. ERC-38]|uniref:hypothetical protein n=1 Tax=Aquimarina sp. ERC-38 TaxID=2949996 RepID=UPI002245C37E|nr:hypothetical protein [Aquimarina sp. ERC-38]UZO82101.1 hypothetical protein NBT05_06410 [Aquimarina sp. ERC-38]